MRKEIIEALEYARTLGRRPTPIVYQSPPDPSVDYSQFVTEEDRQNLARVGHNMDAIQTCLEKSPLITDSYAGSTTSIVVLIGEQEGNQLVIELTLYGPLAALFSYGEVPKEVLDLVSTCIEGLGLVQLSKAETAELERTGEYLELFE